MIRRKVIKLVSQVSARTRVIRTIDRINGRKGGVIVVFHQPTYDVLSSQLGYLAEVYTFVSLDEFVGRLEGGKSTIGLAAITFDDGVGAVTEAGATLALKYGWPMTFYLPTRYLDTGEPYWFLELDHLLRAAAGQTLEVNGISFPLTDSKSLSRTSEALRKQFKKLSTAEEATALLKQIRRSLFGSSDRPGGLRVPSPIPWDRVRKLATHEEISFQAHTINHLAVSRLSTSALMEELEGSRRRIQEVTGKEVHHFCYPYGSPDEIGTSAPATVRKLFRSGTTTGRGRCASGVDLALLPRIPLDEADTEEVVALKVGSAR
jgi:peptidoglycan/xylan/chitin deacetylase (PgdA/CDA1 family)